MSQLVVNLVRRGMRYQQIGPDQPSLLKNRATRIIEVIAHHWFNSLKTKWLSVIAVPAKENPTDGVANMLLREEKVASGWRELWVL